MNCFSTVKGAKDFKDHFMNISIYIALVPLWCHSSKEKSRRSGKWNNANIKNSKPKQSFNNNFSPLGNGVFGFSIDLCATIMLQTMRRFINKNSNSSLKIIRVVVSNIRQVKAFTRIMMENNLWDYLRRAIYNFLLNIWGNFIIKINNPANCFQSKCYGSFNKLFHFWKCFEIMFYL